MEWGVALRLSASKFNALTCHYKDDKTMESVSGRRDWSNLENTSEQNQEVVWQCQALSAKRTPMLVEGTSIRMISRVDWVKEE